MKIHLKVDSGGNKFWGVRHQSYSRHRYEGHPAVLLINGYRSWYEYGVKTGDNRAS